MYAYATYHSHACVRSRSQAQLRLRAVWPQSVHHNNKFGYLAHINCFSGEENKYSHQPHKVKGQVDATSFMYYTSVLPFPGKRNLHRTVNIKQWDGKE